MGLWDAGGRQRKKVGDRERRRGEELWVNKGRGAGEKGVKDVIDHRVIKPTDERRREQMRGLVNKAEGRTRRSGGGGGG